MSSGTEARAAAEAACETGKPVWVSWTLHEEASSCLRSGETISEAASLLADLPVSGLLVNCCSPKSVTRAIPLLAAATTTAQRIGGYANTFHPIPTDWRLDGDKNTDGLLSLRNDLDPDAYADHAIQWLAAGATVIGGCCGTRPAHIQKLRGLLPAP
jgi:S-methylmethionine-dependent homocysteine/selenocysteine methylase